MKNQQRFVIGLVLTLLVVIFALMNSQSVTVNFFGAHLQWPLIVLIVVSLLIGAGITLLLSASSISAARKTSKRLQTELNKLRSDKDKPEPKVIEAEVKDKK
jgi:uncharacterized integral membrane protein